MDKQRALRLRQDAKNAETQASSATSRTKALDAAITAAELYMKALKVTDSPSERRYLDTNCKKWLGIAEKVKVESNWQLAVSTAARIESSIQKPVSTRKLATKEQIIILEGSKLNGFIFPPWKGEPKAEEFASEKDKSLFVDEPQLGLSQEQRNMFAGWKRPSVALTRTSLIDGSHEPITPTMGLSMRCDLVQDATSDCSIVASLCAGTARAERGHTKVGRDDTFVMPCSLTCLSFFPRFCTLTTIRIAAHRCLPRVNISFGSLSTVVSERLSLMICFQRQQPTESYT